MLKFIPVRGRKQMDTNKLLVNNVEIYPREGTETFEAIPIHTAPSLKSIPVRGRKLLGISKVTEHSR